MIPCPVCKGTGAEFPGNPRTEKCEECNGTGKVIPKKHRLLELLSEVARCDKEIAWCFANQHNFLNFIGHADWEAEKQLLLNEIEKLKASVLNG